MAASLTPSPANTHAQTKLSILSAHVTTGYIKKSQTRQVDECIYQEAIPGFQYRWRKAQQGGRKVVRPFQTAECKGR